MNTLDRIVERVSQIVAERILEDEDGKPDAKPLTDVDGDVRCETCQRPFVTRAALRQHVTKKHAGGPG